MIQTEMSNQYKKIMSFNMDKNIDNICLIE